MCPSIIRVRWVWSVVAGAVLTIPPAVTRGQLIAPKTVPVFQGEQFDIFPALYPGMGGVGIALNDTLADPWSNPAKAARIRVGSVQVMPFTHSATGGGGRTLPVSIFQAGGRITGGALFSLQELERRDAAWNATNSERNASNQYLAGVLAWQAGAGLSIGAGLRFADLNAVDGVGAMYGGSDRLQQSGSQVDARLGITRDFDNGSTVELVGVRHQYEMTHDVHFPERWVWNPCCTAGATVPARDEHNEDRSNNTGLHAVYLAPETSGGWRVGYVVTANRITHPKIPNYVFQNIPRDPGSTDAFNVGLGASRHVGRSLFALDILMEPMWSRTWADLAQDTVDVGGSVIPKGAHTVDNHFRFSNARINVGLAHELVPVNDSAAAWSFQLGVGLRSITYTLDQSDHIQRTSRSQDESWIEWSPSAAIRVRMRDLDVSYAITRTCGPGSCVTGLAVARNFNAPDAISGPGVIAAPNGPLTFDGGSSGQHRVTISIRMR